jgi:hypothetical protein
VVVAVVAVAALLMVAAGCSDPVPAGLNTGVPEAAATGAATPDAAATGTAATAVATNPVAGTGTNEDDPEAMPASDSGLRDMASISDGLGYALVPGGLPLDFTLVSARLVDIPGKPLATVFYGDGRQRLSLFYPATFMPDFVEQTPSASEALARPGTFSPPKDAVVRVVVGGELAYLMKGEWDGRTVQLLASYTAQWEYNGRLTLYFEYEADSGHRQWAMLSANTQRDSWIGVGGMIHIAESMATVQ